jgi:class 3 adenylate cyclase
VRHERKVVTVLFCDLAGFTSRAEEMDPEDVAALLAPYHARLQDELERFGGTVEKFIGDAVMALFGAPTAHEDDPERAVRAALAIRDFAVDEAIELRIGITTGEALVSLEARPDQGQTMATGDVINTAARLQPAAPVNGILVGEPTYRATRDAIEYREHDPVEAKGKARPVGVWLAHSARARITLDRLHGTALVGRTPEIALLEGALNRARQERSPQLVTIVGVPGIGKSRLVFELFQAVEHDPDLISWRQGRCLPYGDGVTFWALGEIVKAQAGILETDSIEQTEAKLRAVAGDRWVESHLRPLVGVASEHELGGDRRGEAFAAWRQFLESLAEERPLVIVIEDLHWADETLLDFIDYVVEWTSGVPLLAVCTARPELLERRPGWGGGKPNSLTLSLSPLSDEETARLIGDLLERSVLPAETQEALLTRTGGNPLYAEQFARMLEERGKAPHDEWPLPETVQGLIAARLDLLPSEEKAVLQNAAVLGKTFWSGALESHSGQERSGLDDRLHALELKQFVRRERQSTVADQEEYSFRHLLVRDVAYGQIPRSDRAEKHRLAAEWIESLGRPDDQAEMLAHHYLQALELTRASGGDVESLVERARLTLRDAGDRALALNARPSAARFYEAAVELWPEDDPNRPQLLFRYGSSLRHVERGGPILEDAYVELARVGDSESAAETQAMLATFAWQAGDRDRCFDHLEIATALLEGAPASRAKAYVLAQVCRYRMLAGENEEAIRVGAQAFVMAEEVGGLDEVKASVLNSAGVSRISAGDNAGIDDIEHSIAIALAANSAESLRGYTNLASIHYSAGDLERGAELTAEGIRLSERFGDETNRRFLRGHQMLGANMSGAWDRCLALADEFIAEAEAGSPHYHEAGARCLRALIRLGRDDPVGAAADADRALMLARRVKDPQVIEPVLGGVAFVFRQTGRANEAQALAAELAQTLSTTEHFVALEGNFPGAWVLVDAGLQARLLSALDRVPALPWHKAARAVALDDPVSAADTYRAIGSLTDEAYCRLRAAGGLVAKGRRGEADDQLQQALIFYRSVGATRYIREGEELLAAAS